MTSLDSNSHPKPKLLLRVVYFVAAAVVLGIVMSLGINGWLRYGAHNIFDAIIAAEWNYGSRYETNPAMDEKYEVELLFCEHGVYGPKKEIRYVERTDSFVMHINPQLNKTSINECDMSLWEEHRATWLSIFFSETISEDLYYFLEIEYNRIDRTLTEWVEVRYQGATVTSDTAVTVLADNGVTGDYLRSKRDWLLLEEVLPDLLAANPGVKFTVEDWGRVTVTTDRHLS